MVWMGKMSGWCVNYVGEGNYDDVGDEICDGERVMGERRGMILPMNVTGSCW